MKTLIFFLLLSFNSFALVLTPAPTTKGGLCTKQDPNFKELRYKDQIPVCTRNVTTQLKTKIYKAYGVPDSERSQYTIDHLIPLSMGGSNNEDNLWPQPKVISTAPVEKILFDMIFAGELSVEDAHKIIYSIKLERTQ